VGFGGLSILERVLNQIGVKLVAMVDARLELALIVDIGPLAVTFFTRDGLIGDSDFLGIFLPNGHIILAS
jgi:hypothetical protein